jgi:DNA-binding CsgD family transcriptional regulator
VLGLVGFPFPLGAVWLDESTHVVARNYIAAEILAERDGLLFVQGRLIATRPHEAFELTRLVGSACATARASDAGGGVTRISRSERRRSLTVFVSPLRWPGLALPIDMPAAVVFMSDPERKPPTWQVLLRCLYRLTRTEAEVAVLVLGGERVAGIARARGTSDSTARTHLRRIFGKVGVQSQADLIRVLLGGAVMVPTNGGRMIQADVVEPRSARLRAHNGS